MNTSVARERLRAAARVGAAALLCGACLLAGCQSPVVGAACREDLTLCGDRCVDLASDPQHCGGCDLRCADGQSCRAGQCTVALDGSVADGAIGAADGSVVDSPDGALDGGGPSDAGAPGDGGVLDSGAGVDAGAPLPGCGLGERRCDGVCVRVGSDPDNCGACGVSCGAAEVCAAGVCGGGCGSPLGICEGLCVDLRTDPDNCGSCGIRCPSGVCRGGACAGPVAGHAVVIGHSYEQSRAAMNRLVGNAVFLSRRDPTRVVVYEGVARPEAIAGTDAAIAQVAAELGRDWTRTALADPAGVPVALVDAEVLLVYAQSDAGDEDLLALGELWARALGTFLRAGGVVVVLDGLGRNRGTHQLLEPAGLLQSFGIAHVTGRVLDVALPGDAVALGLPLRYRGERSTLRLDARPGDVVVTDGVGPVVLHRVVRP